MPKKARVFSREFKLMVVRRMEEGEPVRPLARELNVLCKDLYIWRDRYRSGGAEALRGCGRPRKLASTAPVPGESAKAAEATTASPAAELEAARRRIAERERKIGQQQVDLDFFSEPCAMSGKHAG